MEYATFRFIGTSQTFQTRNTERVCMFWTINSSTNSNLFISSNLIPAFFNLASTSGDVSSLYHSCFNSLSGMYHINKWYDTSLVRSTYNYSRNLKRSRRLKQDSNKVEQTLKGWILNQWGFSEIENQGKWTLSVFSEFWSGLHSSKRRFCRRIELTNLEIISRNLKFFIRICKIIDTFVLQRITSTIVATIALHIKENEAF